MIKVIQIEKKNNGALCNTCQTQLVIMDNGIPTCTHCGRMNKKYIWIIRPEWRFYGADDKKGFRLPTRCGNPINPLLQESSFGCKILWQLIIHLMR